VLRFEIDPGSFCSVELLSFLYRAVPDMSAPAFVLRVSPSDHTDAVVRDPDVADLHGRTQDGRRQVRDAHQGDDQADAERGMVGDGAEDRGDYRDRQADSDVITNACCANQLGPCGKGTASNGWRHVNDAHQGDDQADAERGMVGHAVEDDDANDCGDCQVRQCDGDVVVTDACCANQSDPPGAVSDGVRCSECVAERELKHDKGHDVGRATQQLMPQEGDDAERRRECRDQQHSTSLCSGCELHIGHLWTLQGTI
jgi:hypothetical protein